MSDWEREKIEEAGVNNTAAHPSAKEEAGAQTAPASKRRGRPPGSGAAGTASAGVKPAEAPPAAGDTKAAPPRRDRKAEALAARQAEEEALELQKLTAPHIQGCSPEWQQFYLKVRRVAVIDPFYNDPL
jgi:hypothetical protein